jgi:D-tyrosyl-tRNA(Tyr) deacylase
MRAVVQRASEASLSIDGDVRCRMGLGLVVLLGVEAADTADDLEWLAGKIVRLRVFGDEAGRMNRSVLEVQGDLLLVSQFTLFASTRKGNRPSYSRAATGPVAAPVFAEAVRVFGVKLGRSVLSGEFGANMQVALVNDGPVTILVDSKQRE